MVTIRLCLVWFGLMVAGILPACAQEDARTAELSLQVRWRSTTPKSQKAKYETQESFHKICKVLVEVTPKGQETKVVKSGEVRTVTEEDVAKGAGWASLSLWEGKIPTGTSTLPIAIKIRQEDPEGRVVDVGEATAYLSQQEGFLKVEWVMGRWATLRQWASDADHLSNSEPVKFERTEYSRYDVRFLASSSEEVQSAKDRLESEQRFIQRLRSELDARQSVDHIEIEERWREKQIRVRFIQAQADVHSGLLGVIGPVRVARIFVVSTLRKDAEDWIAAEFPGRTVFVPVEDQSEIKVFLVKALQAKAKEVSPGSVLGEVKCSSVPAWTGLKSWSDQFLLGESIRP